MPVPVNKLKAALSDGKRQLGLWLAMAHPTSAEIAAGAGFDFCLIDGEHAPNDIPIILTQLRAMGGGDATPVVRVPTGDPRLIKQVLDLGAQSLLIPMIDTPEEAETMVRATRYPPEGFRGVGAAMARSGQFGGIPDVVTTANEQICVLVQAESQTALGNIEKIAKTGVDGIFIGPADLAADMGFPGNPGAEEVQAAIKDGVARIRAAGLAAGLISFDRAGAERYVSWGANFVAVGGDVHLLASGIRNASKTAEDLRNL